MESRRLRLRRLQRWRSQGHHKAAHQLVAVFNRNLGRKRAFRGLVQWT